MGLNKAGLSRFIDAKARRFVAAAIDAAADELAGRSDLEIRTSGINASANIISAELRVRAKETDILREELGTEGHAPLETVGRLVKDPTIRSRIVRKAAKSL